MSEAAGGERQNSDGFLDGVHEFGDRSHDLAQEEHGKREGMIADTPEVKSKARSG